MTSITEKPVFVDFCLSFKESRYLRERERKKEREKNGNLLLTACLPFSKVCLVTLLSYYFTVGCEDTTYTTTTTTVTVSHTKSLILPVL